ncbi:MAG: DUF4132 domain-containing protein [Gemmataceae bacterium]
MSDRNADSVQTVVTNHILLSPADWATATWRPRQPLTRPPAVEFAPRRCLARLGNHGMARYNYLPLMDWKLTLDIASLSPEEAHFWFVAMTEGQIDMRPLAERACADPDAFTGRIERDEIRQRLRQRAGYLTAEVMIPLAFLLSPPALLEALLDDELFVLDSTRYHHYQLINLQNVLIDGFRLYVLPYLDDATVDELRQIARGRVPSSLWSQSTPPTLEQTLAYRLAPVLGLHRELLSLVSTWPNNAFPKRGGYEEWRRLPREMIFGLGDPTLVEQHMRRLGLLLRNEADGRAWLAHTETRALDYLRESAVAGPGYNSVKLTEVLCLVEAPEAARPLLELRLGGHACPPLQRWFHGQVGNAVAGLLPLAGGRGKLADAARNYLRELTRRGLTGAIEEQLGGVDTVVAGRVRTSVLVVAETAPPPFDLVTTPGWLRYGISTLPALPQDALPNWVVAEDLPPLVVGDRCLNRGQVLTLIRALSAVKLDHHCELVRGLRERVDVACREAFVWRLIEQWQCGGAPTRDSWAMHAAGWLGGDESAVRLTALIRDSVGTVGRHRAGVAMTCLLALGSSLAMAHLAALSRQVRSRPLRERARDLLDAYAEARGLSRTELEDQLVPTLGFDGERGPVFDFGKRRFEARLAPGLRLVLRDPAGRVRADLPAPGARDDPERARQAIADWRLLRKALREVTREQSARLERAMVSGQRWPMRYFHAGVLRQPLLAQLARLVLWAGYDDRGRLASTFRVTDELTFVDAEESRVSLADFNSVRVVHPIELAEPQRLRWAAVWRDHELIAPFAQLGRRLFPLADAERQHTEITRFRGRRVPGLTLSSHVKIHDWLPVTVDHGRPGEAHAKAFPGARVVAVLRHPNVGQFGYPHHLSEQELHTAYFLRGVEVDGEAVSPAGALPLAEVSPLVYSEVCELMAWLHNKGKE